MSVQRAADAAPVAPPPSTPGEIREVLLPEEVGQFDREWRSAMKRSAETLDLGDVYRVLDRWRSIAELTAGDPDAHRRMLSRIDRITDGGHRGTLSAADQRAMIARRLGR